MTPEENLARIAQLETELAVMSGEIAELRSYIDDLPKPITVYPESTSSQSQPRTRTNTQKSPRFVIGPNVDSPHTVDVEIGSWWEKDQDEIVSIQTQGIGNESNTYIVVTKDTSSAVHTISVAAQPLAPLKTERDTKRVLAVLEYTDSKLTGINRRYVGGDLFVSSSLPAIETWYATSLTDVLTSRPASTDESDPWVQAPIPVLESGSIWRPFLTTVNGKQILKVFMECQP